MATILDLYNNTTRNKVKNDIYGNEASRIETKGIVNIPRTVALLLSSPDATADALGSQVAGVVKGIANRPSDTIFKNNARFSKPVTLKGGVSIKEKDIKDAIESGTPYFVKQSPAPASIYTKIKQGATSPVGLVSQNAAAALRSPNASANTIKGLIGSIKNKNFDAQIYGTQYMHDENGSFIKNKKGKKFSDFVPIYTEVSNDFSVGGNNEYTRTSIDAPVETPKKNIKNILRTKDGGRTWTKVPKEQYEKEQQQKAPKNATRTNWDIVNTEILNFNQRNDERGNAYDYEKEFNEKHEKNKLTYIKIQPYGKAANTLSKIILPGTITSLSEDFSPEWNNFRYIGSPFMNYRYVGVERSIKFTLKLYYTDLETKINMIQTIEKLKTLVYPDENISAITYGSKDSQQTNALAFSPMLFYFTLTGLYNNLFGFIEDLSFSIDDAVSWATTGDSMSGNDIAPYPTVFEVSMGIKIIPNFEIQKTTDTSKYVFDFNNNNSQII